MSAMRMCHRSDQGSAQSSTNTGVSGNQQHNPAVTAPALFGGVSCHWLILTITNRRQTCRPGTFHHQHTGNSPCAGRGALPSRSNPAGANGLLIGKAVRVYSVVPVAQNIGNFFDHFERVIVWLGITATE